MILMNCHKYKVEPSTLREIYIKCCNMCLLDLQVRESLGLKQLLKLYDISDIKRAFNSISIDNFGHLYIPEQSYQNTLLRYLEFGGQGVRPTHLLSNAKDKLIKLKRG